MRRTARVEHAGPTCAVVDGEDVAACRLSHPGCGSPRSCALRQGGRGGEPFIAIGGPSNSRRGHAQQALMHAQPPAVAMSLQGVGDSDVVARRTASRWQDVSDQRYFRPLRCDARAARVAVGSGPAGRDTVVGDDGNAVGGVRTDGQRQRRWRTWAVPSVTIFPDGVGGTLRRAGSRQSCWAGSRNAPHTCHTITSAARPRKHRRSAVINP